MLLSFGGFKFIKGTFANLRQIGGKINIMRRIFLVLICIISFSNCNDRKADKMFELDFNNAINSVDRYDNYRGSLHDWVLADFYFSVRYLERLTGIESSVICSEPPYFSSRKDCLNDIKKWKKWYKENKYNITDEQSDSIQKFVYDIHIWW